MTTWIKAKSVWYKAYSMAQCYEDTTLLNILQGPHRVHLSNLLPAHFKTPNMRCSASATALCFYTVAAAAALPYNNQESFAKARTESNYAVATIQFISTNGAAPIEVEVPVGATSDKSSNPIKASKAAIIKITPGTAVGAQQDVKAAKVSCTMRIGFSSKELGPVTIAAPIELGGIQKVTGIDCDESV
ncbi:hypothetical protein K491DRAFT_487512 [Lophiostoma macrostomum CBS 122681]|uniref:Uncharacterized protein n=1 Tax=Lophiostoma macrostomum CBS 122681 TaxID=1314788 RepID=A0A6A6T5N5_9PLEO|nr:hypothetical protein K491DRAFT_487512 [Lophiostoma macrostomum CBS 122681]